MKRYSIYTVANDLQHTDFQFFESQNLPAGITISTPLTFPFLDSKIALCFDKNNWWNPLGGHIEDGETFADTLVRESFEEAGVTIQKSSIKVVGYIKSTNYPDSQDIRHPPESVLPITTSTAISMKGDWKPMETTNRGLFLPNEALSLMKVRDDNNQMWEILDFIIRTK